MVPTFSDDQAWFLLSIISDADNLQTIADTHRVYSTPCNPCRVCAEYIYIYLLVESSLRSIVRGAQSSRGELTQIELGGEVIYQSKIRPETAVNALTLLHAYLRMCRTLYLLQEGMSVLYIPTLLSCNTSTRFCARLYETNPPPIFPALTYLPKAPPLDITGQILVCHLRA